MTNEHSKQSLKSAFKKGQIQRQRERQRQMITEETEEDDGKFFAFMIIGPIFIFIFFYLFSSFEDGRGGIHGGSISFNTIPSYCRYGHYNGTTIANEMKNCSVIVVERVTELKQVAQLANQGHIPREVCEMLSNELIDLVPTYNKLINLMDKAEEKLESIDYFSVGQCPTNL